MKVYKIGGSLCCTSDSGLIPIIYKELKNINKKSNNLYANNVNKNFWNEVMSSDFTKYNFHDCGVFGMLQAQKFNDSFSWGYHLPTKGPSPVQCGVRPHIHISRQRDLECIDLAKPCSLSTRGLKMQ